MVLGAISLSGESAMMHVHTLGLVRQAAETVTSQLRERERMRDLATTNQYLRALIESDSRGIVTVDSHGRIVQTNRSARAGSSICPSRPPGGISRTLPAAAAACWSILPRAKVSRRAKFSPATAGDAFRFL